MEFDVTTMSHREINDALRGASGKVTLRGTCGQRFIAAGMSGLDLTIEGVPGNALGAYLNGATITVHANAQDAVGDTMDSGRIVVHGNIGDAVGYAMRGGELYIKGNAGYRAGIHMKEYQSKCPLLVIGGKCGSFLGEYQAGGTIIVLGIGAEDSAVVGNFPCTGMHGGRVYLRSDCKNVVFPPKVKVRRADKDDIARIEDKISEFCRLFGYDKEEIIGSGFTIVEPDSNNPYKQMYVAN